MDLMRRNWPHCQTSGSGITKLVTGMWCVFRYRTSESDMNPPSSIVMNTTFFFTGNRYNTRTSLARRTVVVTGGIVEVVEDVPSGMVVWFSTELEVLVESGTVSPTACLSIDEHAVAAQSNTTVNMRAVIRRFPAQQRCIFSE